MFSDNAIKVLQKRYFLRDEQGVITEGVEELFRRVADAVSAAERQWSDSEEHVGSVALQFFNAMLSQKFVPNSPTLMNAGKARGQLSACFVLPVPDSLEGIFETCKHAALVHQTGGGTGFSFSRLRPANDRVASSMGVASGPVSFMTVYDAATEAIRQGGTRRGANMGMLRVDHPDIEEFISCKQDTSRLNNFNISVAATDSFMNAVENDTTYDLMHPRTGLPVRSLRAKEIFDKIAENAHATGEPGLVFIDRINAVDPIRHAVDEAGNSIRGTEDIEATNPCGEQPLGPGDACNLGSINVSKLVDLAACDFDWRALEELIELAVRFLDDVIEANHYPLPFIAEATLNNRRIGLGIMGWAESLIKLGIPYDSEEAIAKAEQLMEFVQEKAHAASRRLAQERGCFPNWQYSTWHDKGIAMRNATVTTIAPTGTISIIAGTSSGIEPLFAISFVRRVLGGMELIDVNPLFERLAKERGFFSEELMQRIAQQGTVAHIDEVPADVKRLWVCSHDIPYIWHVRMQVAFQRHTDNAVSKTINFPYNASVEDVEQSYLAAWRLGLKGITVYRDASRASQVLNISQTDPLRRTSDSPVVAADFGTPKKGGSAASMGTVTSPPVKHENKLTSLHGAVRVLSGRIVSGISAVAEEICNGNCPECGTSTQFHARAESCLLCLSCGYTKC
ncbi:MAG TPA: adenosylcobalamin-dependent ribonucleoside-diphosphate reductase [Planktothrix sp.]|jgi:ribonucleoside-diphosphate reductase alpha chain